MREGKTRLPPRWFVVTFWHVHRWIRLRELDPSPLHRILVADRVAGSLWPPIGGDAIAHAAMYSRAIATAAWSVPLERLDDRSEMKLRIPTRSAGTCG